MDDETLREVTAFIVDEVGCEPSKVTPEATLLWDLGIDGVEADYFFEAFVERFGVDLSASRLNRHFHPEGVLPFGCNPFALLAVLWGDLNRYDLFPGFVPRIPITVSDLVQAVRTKRWPIEYS